jgi:hypothetical protein
MLACERCAQQVQQQMPKDSHAAFVKALVFGMAAAILGMLLYAGIVVVTRAEFALAAVGVAYLIGKAMRAGSGGIGGRRYQIAAALLTYGAVSMAAVPVAVYLHYRPEGVPAVHSRGAHGSPDRQASPPSGPRDSEQGSAQGDVQDLPPAPHKTNVFALAGRLLMLGLASPFLELQNSLSGVIGLVILFAGISFAWKLTAGSSVEILGPFLSTAGSALPSATT